jgi:hypothetical protein
MTVLRIDAIRWWVNACLPVTSASRWRQLCLTASQTSMCKYNCLLTSFCRVLNVLSGFFAHIMDSIRYVRLLLPVAFELRTVNYRGLVGWHPTTRFVFLSSYTLIHLCPMTQQCLDVLRFGDLLLLKQRFDVTATSKLKQYDIGLGNINSGWRV